MLPSVNYFGSGSINQLKEIATANNFKRALIVSDSNLEKIGYVDTIKNILTEVGVASESYTNVQPNPTVQNVEEALAIQQQTSCDCVIGLGGGSANDCSKAVAIVGANGGELIDYVGVNQSTKPSLPLVCINTTAGTATEISRAFIISDHEREEKLIFKDIHALPDYSINDIDLMMKLPAHVTAQTGIDALTHAVEAYVSNGTNNLTKLFATDAVKLIFKHLERVVAVREDSEGREAMIHAEFLAGMAFCNSGVGLAHAIAHALGAIYDLPHGLCNALVLPTVMAYNATDEQVCAQYAALSESVLEIDGMLTETEKTGLLITRIKELTENVGIEFNLSNYGVKEEDFALIVDKTIKDGNYPRNPLSPNKAELKSILEKMI